MTTTAYLPTGLIEPGDVVLTHGMRVRIDSIRPYHAGGRGCISSPDAGTLTQCDLTWSCAGTVLNLAEVLAAHVIPRSFLFDSERDRLGPGHGREDTWNVQGNNLAMWTVERADDECAICPPGQCPGPECPGSLRDAL